MQALPNRRFKHLKRAYWVWERALFPQQTIIGNQINMAVMDRLQPFLCFIWALLCLPFLVHAQNDMQVLGNQSLTPDEVTDSMEISYLIRFQNVGMDTAKHIAVRDTLDPRLDPATFIMVRSSHPCSLLFNGGPVVRWYFKDINLPSKSQSISHSVGWVLFKVKPKVFLTPGQVIRNRACTVFDDTYSVCTNEALLWIDEKLDARDLGVEDNAAYQVYPNPNDGQFDLLADAEKSQANTNSNASADCWITDIQGRRIWQEQTDINQIDSRRVMLDNATPGLYWLYVKTGRRVHVSQFVILR